MADGKMTLTLFLSTTEPQIEDIKKELVKLLHHRIQRKIIPELRKTITRVIRASFFNSILVHDILARKPIVGHLGIPKGQEKRRLNEIAQLLIKKVFKIEFIDVNSGAKDLGDIRVLLMLDREIMMDLSQLPASLITTDKGATLPWLEWLLFAETDPIVLDYTITFKQAIVSQHKSRSKLAVMIKAVDKYWSVPAEYAGSPNDNFLTQVIHEVGQKLVPTLKRKIRKLLKQW